VTAAARAASGKSLIDRHAARFDRPRPLLDFAADEAFEIVGAGAIGSDQIGSDRFHANAQRRHIHGFDRDAIARVIPKPIDFFGKIPASSGLHLVNIPFTKTFEDLYTLGEFTKQDYPNLLQGQDRIDTIAVPAVLAVFNWQKNSDRYNRVERFSQYLFSCWDTYHPKWRDVNLAATVPGWTRFSVAEQLLQQMQVEQQQKQQQRAAFETFLSNQPKMPVSDADREDLFRKFLQWQAREHR